MVEEEASREERFCSVHFCSMPQSFLLLSSCSRIGNAQAQCSWPMTQVWQAQYGTRYGCYTVLPLVGGHRKKVSATPLPMVRAYEIVAPDSICVDHLVAQPTGDGVGKGLAELKIEEGTRVKLSGEGFPAPVYWFEKAGLAESVLQTLAMSQFETPTPVQRYSMPMVLAGRDLLVCAQEGSGKMAALCIPVVSGLVTAAAAGGRTYDCFAKPRALLLVPNNTVAAQIGEDARKLAHQTGIRVVHSRTKRHVQIGELESGVDIFVSTPGCLIDMFQSKRVTLEAIEYLVIYQIGWMLDLGFEEGLRKIVDDMDMPRKSARRTLLSSDTFEPEVQKLAWDFLSNYLLITDGRLEFNIGLTRQKFELVSEGKKRGFLLNVFREQTYRFAGMLHQRATVVFVETKGEAVLLRNWLYKESFPATVICGDSSEQERKSALISFQTGLTPILIAADAASLDLDVANVTCVINYDLPKSIEEYIERIRKFRRARRVGSVTSFFAESNQSIAKGLRELMIETKLEVPDWLVDYADPDYSCRFKELELQDEEHEKYRYDLAVSLLSRKINNIYDLVDVYAELNCKNKKRSSLEDDIKRMCRDCCIAFEQQEEYKLLKFMFVKLVQHCFIPENCGKTYRHYNFVAKIKNTESGIWTPGTYFAESKLERGVQKYFCCLLEPSDNGECYGCQNEKAVIQHPTTGDYQRATPDHVWPFDGDIEISDSDDDLMDY